MAVVASRLVERQAEEISVYRSRGASTAQLVGLYLMEGVFMAAIAAAVGPWIAGQAVAALGYTPTFSLMTNGGALPAAITPEAYLLAAGGAALALLALLLPAFALAPRGLVATHRAPSPPPRARPPPRDSPALRAGAPPRSGHCPRRAVRIVLED